MTKPNTLSKQKERLTKRLQGYKRLDLWVINNEEARQLVKQFVADTNERFNCFKFEEK